MTAAAVTARSERSALEIVVAHLADLHGADDTGPIDEERLGPPEDPVGLLLRLVLLDRRPRRAEFGDELSRHRGGVIGQDAIDREVVVGMLGELGGE